MRTNSRNTSIYIGKGAGNEVLEKIRSAKHSVKIVSPYLTPTYIEELIKLKRRGVDVTLITSDKLEEGRGVYSDLTHTDVIKQKRMEDEVEQKRRGNGIKYSLLSYLIPIILFYVFSYSFLSVILVLVSTISLIFYYNLRIYTYKYQPLFKLKVFYSAYDQEKNHSNFIHSKIYVIDEKVAYVGSINFTYKGFKYNYETATKVNDPMAIREISKEVDRLYNSSELSKSIEEWGRELYDEPKH
jgi:phosphatidylserine/phosphatidylglycerophosphate/cardiolipin synthase-like enzyme